MTSIYLYTTFIFIYIWPIKFDDIEMMKYWNDFKCRFLLENVHIVDDIFYYKWLAWKLDVVRINIKCWVAI